ncbi:hypothetical protein CPB83DRAFT_422893 [Crepidotus variabilis]|uniref:Uncharacterized protein n=1 Tax=Crepidotus variabilis TaxID=179855 RepID=A0A9P6ESD9_9AGAR|nr:hypothetical protein CPB83DRAFT_422893 [Crepidotus variabilis]
MHPQEQDYPKFYRMEEMPLHPHETGLLLRKSVSDAVLPLEELNGSQETKERDRNDGSVPVTRFGECKRPEETSDAQDSLGFKQDGHFQDRHDVDVEKSHLHLDEHSSSHSTVTRTQNMPSGYTFTYANSSPHPSSSSLPRTSSSSAQRGASTRIPRRSKAPDDDQTFKSGT